MHGHGGVCRLAFVFVFDLLLFLWYLPHPARAWALRAHPKLSGRDFLYIQCWRAWAHSWRVADDCTTGDASPMMPLVPSLPSITPLPRRLVPGPLLPPLRTRHASAACHPTSMRVWIHLWMAVVLGKAVVNAAGDHSRAPGGGGWFQLPTAPTAHDATTTAPALRGHALHEGPGALLLDNVGASASCSHAPGADFGPSPTLPRVPTLVDGAAGASSASMSPHSLSPAPSTTTGTKTSTSTTSPSSSFSSSRSPSSSASRSLCPSATGKSTEP